MQDTKRLVDQLYAAFNSRDIDRALALMSEAVDWPKASEGGRVVGKAGIRAYWTRQWADFDPHVDPIQVIDRERGRTEVRVHQVVRNGNGDVLSDTEVWHIYSISNGFVDRMDLGGSDPDSREVSVRIASAAWTPAH